MTQIAEKDITQLKKDLKTTKEALGRLFEQGFSKEEILGIYEIRNRILRRDRYKVSLLSIARLAKIITEVNLVKIDDKFYELVSAIVQYGKLASRNPHRNRSKDGIFVNAFLRKYEGRTFPTYASALSKLSIEFSQIDLEHYEI